MNLLTDYRAREVGHWSFGYGLFCGFIPCFIGLIAMSPLWLIPALMTAAMSRWCFLKLPLKQP